MVSRTHPGLVKKLFEQEVPEIADGTVVIKSIAREAQVLCVTHSAQIVSLADHHYYIYKEEVAGRTETRVRTLEEEERVEEIARILGGMQVTDAQRESARELMKEIWE